jgi:hypothetical protein
LKTKFYFLFISLAPLFIEAKPTQLTIRGFSEGYYRSLTGKMLAVLDPINLPFVCDSGKVTLFDSITQSEVYCTNILINTYGYGTCLIPSVFHGQKFILSIKFRNTLHVVSANSFLFDDQSLLVDLTIPSNTRCCVDTTGGVAKAYSGDLNGDGILESEDYAMVENGSVLNLTGYQITDVNGDNIVNTLDIVILYNNVIKVRVDGIIDNCAPFSSTILNFYVPGVDIFPNPCKDYFFIKSDSTFLHSNFQIIDVLGKVCKSGTIHENLTTIDCSDLTNGFYLLNLYNNIKNSGRSIIISQ